MTQSLPQYPKDLEEIKNWKNLDITDQYSQFDRLLNQAREKSIFETLPNSPAGAMTREFKKQGEAMAEQLWLLGYLEAKDKHRARKAFHQDRKGFLASAALFQKEAGLKPDAWTGKKTRAALNSLISFETNHLEKRWLNSPHEYPAVIRAAQCRLFVLGLAPERPAKAFSALSFSALKKFKRLTLALGTITLEKDQIKPFLDARTPSPALLGLILDQDSLIKAVALSCRQGSCGLKFNIPSRKNLCRHLPQAYEIRRFLTRLTQVEFWLMGYDIPLAEKLEYPVKGVDTKNQQDCDPELKNCLMDFAGLAQKKKSTWAKEITPELFTTFNDAWENQDDERVLSQVNSKLKQPREIENALEQGRKLHLRLWDGIKRVLRWIRQALKRTVHTILDIGKNIARFFYTRALAAFDTVKQGIRIARNALATLDGTFYKAPGICLNLSCDGDVVVGLSDMTCFAKADKALTLIRLNAERFCLAARICTMILSGLVNSILSRWAALAKVLFDNARACIDLIKTIDQLEHKIQALPDA